MYRYAELAAPVIERLAALQTAEGYAPSGNHRIHYAAYGAGPAIVFQHGFPDNASTFVEQVEEFARDYLVITPTLRGYPPSSVPAGVEEYASHVVAEDITAVLDHLGVAQAHVAGHDWGGGIVQRFALAHPERVRSLIILNSPISRSLVKLVNHDIEQQELSEYTIAYLKYEEGDSKNASYITQFIRDSRWRDAITAYLEESPLHGMLSYYKMGYPAPPYGAGVLDDVSSFVHRAPTLIVWGLEDEYFSLKILNNLWEWFSQSYRLVTIPGAGHWVFQDEPQKVNAEIRSWLNEISR